MNVAYVDTSWLIAIVFGEREGERGAAAASTFDVLLSSNLLEAELCAALHREGIASESDAVVGISWILPDRPLRPEIERVLAAGYVRGADLWHLACALHAAQEPADTAFLSFAARQSAVARKLGFTTG